MAEAPELSVDQAADCLRAGGVIAYPTEAVFGLGCDPRNEVAVRKILALKHRSPGKGLILLADKFERFSSYTGDVPAERLEQAMATWPGPITWLFPRGKAVPDWLAGDHPTIALRVSSHPVCVALCAAFGHALVSTSANPTTAAPAKSAALVNDYFGTAIEGIVAGELGDQEQPSEIRDLNSGSVVRSV